MFGKKNRPEEFSDEYRYELELRKILKVHEDYYQNLLREMRANKISSHTITEHIISRINEAVNEIKLEKIEQGSKQEAANVSEKIVSLLNETESMSFTELLDTLGVAKTTLARHLNKLVEDGKIERIETDRTVLYRLKR